MVYSTTGAQDSLKNRLQINGYIKDLQSLNFQQNFTNLTTGNLIHHRLNVKWQPVRRITTAVEIRNRLFWGEEIAQVPDSSREFRNRNEALDLSWNASDHERMVLNTTIDRLWIEYAREKWNVRVGRQRVNWGIGTTWNPNDLFNTFNFLDFDYEERPGVDGVKFQYFMGDMDYVETSISFAETPDKIVSAVRYFNNIATYDLQFIAGIYCEQPTLGFGWSGSIKETGFKGEFQYFFKKSDIKQQLNLTIEVDHVFQKGWYLNTGLFLNTTGITASEEITMITNLQFSPRNLMPTRWNATFTVSKELSPLLAIANTIVYSPNADLTILLPTISYNATENLDINLVWQSFFIEQQSSFGDLSHRCFVRFKWSY
jgi:hypothetical protein